MHTEIGTTLLVILVGLLEAQLQLPVRVMSAIKDEVGYETLLVLHSYSTSCEINLEVYSAAPVLNFDFNQTYFLKRRFNSRFLAVLCVDEVDHNTLRALYVNLNEIRDTPALILSGARTNLSKLFTNCFNNKMLNILAFDTSDPDYIYSYRAFPLFRLTKQLVSQVRKFFEPQLRDLGGFPINSLPDNTLPRSVLYFDAEGNPQLTGYLVEFLRNFVKAMNATLHICWHYMPLHLPDNIIPWHIVSRLTQREIVDIPLFIGNVGAMIHGRLSYTHVLEISKYQLMLPMEREVNRNLLIFRAISPMHFRMSIYYSCLFALLIYSTRCLRQRKCFGVLDVLVDFDPVMRAMLQQTFVMPQKLTVPTMRIYTLLMVFSFMSYNVYIAQLEMLMVHPSTEPMVRNYKDLRDRGLKILLTKAEINIMLGILDDDILEHFWDYHEEVNTSEFQTMRKQPNSSYGYPITHTLWPLIEQKLIKQPTPLFRLSNDFIFYSMVPFAMPLPRNSIFKESLNQYILQTHCSGLYNRWFKTSFSSLLSIGKMEVLPYDNSKVNMHLRWVDLYYIWLLYPFLLGLCCTTFILELVHYYVGRLIRNRSLQSAKSLISPISHRSE